MNLPKIKFDPARIPKLSQIRDMDPVLLSRILFGTILSLCVILASSTVYFYSKYTTLKNKPQVLSIKAPTNTEDTIKTIEDLILLPSGEAPASATVSNKEVLPDNPLFAKAQNGDKILIFKKAGKAILYRPSIHKIVDVMPAEWDEPTPTLDPAITASPTPPNQRKVLIEPKD